MFQDKVVVITGGAGGIGKCIREEFEKAGAKVCVIDIADNPYFVGDIAKEEVRMEKDPESMSKEELSKLIAEVQKKMQKAAADLNFEAAVELRDKMTETIGGATFDENRLLTEIAIFSDKVATFEETIRLLLFTLNCL